MAHICFFARSLLTHGQSGNERHAHILIHGLARHGHRVTVVTTRYPEGVGREDAQGVEIHYLPQAPSRRLSPAFWVASVQAFESIRLKESVDVALDKRGFHHGPR